MVRKTDLSLPHPKKRSIIGISISPTLASKVKAEAGRRQIKLKELFEEMWALYEKRSIKNKL